MKQTKIAGYERRLLAAGSELICFVIAYFSAAKAIDSGSLWLYTLVIVLVIVGIKLCIWTFRWGHEAR